MPKQSPRVVVEALDAAIEDQSAECISLTARRNAGERHSGRASSSR
jgi:hypothetical protein